MKHFFLVLTLLVPLPALAETSTAVKLENIPAPHRNSTMESAVFYPGTDGSSSMIGENGVFYGVEVLSHATPKSGQHPLVLLSHGWGGNLKRMAWLSNGLVENGAIVVAVNHPKSSTGDLNNLEALNHWTRAQDLSAALDNVLADPELAPYIDQNRIFAAGFSYGGWTALSLGGAKARRDGIEKFCNDPAQQISHCADILKAGIKIADIDKASWQSSYKDNRIKAVAAIDPGLTWGLENEDVAKLDVPTLIISLGNGQDRLHATDTSSSGSNFNALVPKATLKIVSPATHFSALGLCKPEGAGILKSENDDPVCTDPPGTDRRAVTREIIASITDHFKL
jgi:predicted dienelactone hydrolase